MKKQESFAKNSIYLWMIFLLKIFRFRKEKEEKMETKFCTKCGIEKPETAEWFSRQRSGKDGLRANCMPQDLKMSFDGVYHHTLKLHVDSEE